MCSAKAWLGVQGLRGLRVLGCYGSGWKAVRGGLGCRVWGLGFRV